MLTVYLYSLVSVFLISLIAFVGLVTLSFKVTFLKKHLFLLVSLAVGALLGNALIHLVPEALEEIGSPGAPLLIIGGLLLFFILEKILHRHHHHDEEANATCPIHPAGRMILVSDGIHNFLDGVIVAASFLVNIEVGVATTLAVLFHEIAQEIGDFGILLHAGYRPRRALVLNFLSGLTALGGALLTLLLGAAVETATIYVAPVAAGGFLYIAVADLIPELHKTTSLKHSLAQLLMIVVGILLMLLLVLGE